jgi:dTDP-4-amino-4,6-dideoxygalactose transaminase
MERSIMASQWAGGHLSAFSFYPTKNLGANGDGGAVLTNDHALAERERLLRLYGWDANRVSQQKGMNARLDEMQAAILRVKLHHLDQWNDCRRELAALYKSLLADVVTMPVELPETHHVYHQFVVRHPQRDALRSYLSEHEIHTQIHYPVPIHLQPAYRNLGLNLGALLLTEASANEILGLPIYSEMTDDMVMSVCSSITAFQSINQNRPIPKLIG